MVAQWLQGKASSGDVAFVITTFMIMSGYLRNMGDNIRMLQRGLADVEDVARYARMTPDVRDAPDAAPFLPGVGEVALRERHLPLQVGREADLPRLLPASSGRASGWRWWVRRGRASRPS